MNSTRSGVLAGGNFVVDTIMRVDRFPDEQMLANIIDEARANGGGPYNVLRDLAAMRAGFPLAAIGLVGDDDNGAWIRRDCTDHGIDVNHLHVGGGMTTSYVHVIPVAGTGRRTFFHRRGANSELDVHHFDFSRTTARIFHYAYFMLLDRLDAVDADGVSGAARVLKAA